MHYRAVSLTREGNFEELIEMKASQVWLMLWTGFPVQPLGRWPKTSASVSLCVPWERWVYLDHQTVIKMEQVRIQKLLEVVSVRYGIAGVTGRANLSVFLPLSA